MSDTRPAARRPLRFGAIALLLALATGCSSVPPPHLFVLSAAAPPVASAQPGTRGLVSVVVDQVQVPDFVDRSQLVQRNGANELRLIDTDQWAEHLSTNITRVLAENLAAMVPADTSPTSAARTRFGYDYLVALSLGDFELDQSRDAVISGRWSITDANGAKELAAATIAMREPPTRPGVAGSVEAMNLGLANISRDIAAAIKRLQAQGGAK